MSPPLPRRGRSARCPGPGAREESRDEPLPHAVGPIESVVEAGGPLDDEQRAEALLLHHRAFVRRTDDDRRRMIRAVGGPRRPMRREDALAARDDASTIARDAIAGLFRHERTDLRLRVERVAPPERRRRRLEPAQELKRSAAMTTRRLRHSAARRRRTRRGDHPRGLVEIRSRPDDRGVVAAELGLERDAAARADLLGDPPRGGGARDKRPRRRRGSTIRSAAVR